MLPIQTILIPSITSASFPNDKQIRNDIFNEKWDKIFKVVFVLVAALKMYPLIHMNLKRIHYEVELDRKNSKKFIIHNNWRKKSSKDLLQYTRMLQNSKNSLFRCIFQWELLTELYWIILNEINQFNQVP